MSKLTKATIIYLVFLLLLIPQYVEMITHGITLNTKLSTLINFDYKLFLYNFLIFSAIPILSIILLLVVLKTFRIANDNNIKRIYKVILNITIFVFVLSFVLSFFLSSTPEQFSFFMTVVAFLSILITTFGKYINHFIDNRANK